MSYFITKQNKTIFFILMNNYKFPSDILLVLFSFIGTYASSFHQIVIFQLIYLKIKHVLAFKNVWDMLKSVYMVFLSLRWYWKVRSGYIWKHFQMWASAPCWSAPGDTLKHLGRNNKCLAWVYNYERNWLIGSFVTPHVSDCKCCLKRSLQDD